MNSSRKPSDYEILFFRVFAMKMRYQSKQVEFRIRYSEKYSKNFNESELGVLH